MISASVLNRKRLEAIATFSEVWIFSAPSVFATSREFKETNRLKSTQRLIKPCVVNLVTESKLLIAATEYSNNMSSFRQFEL